MPSIQGNSLRDWKMELGFREDTNTTVHCSKHQQKKKKRRRRRRKDKEKEKKWIKKMRKTNMRKKIKTHSKFQSESLILVDCIDHAVIKHTIPYYAMDNPD